MTKDEALKLALEALENHTAIKHPQQIHYRDNAIAAIKEALANVRASDTSQERVDKAEEKRQEPVAWMHWLHGPVRLFLSRDEAMMELDRLNREYPVDKDARQMKPLYTKEQL